MIDYNFYKGFYGGNKVINSSQFDRLAMKAKMLVNYYTLGRSKHVIDEDIKDMIKFTICEVIDIYVGVENVGNVKSESIDDYSVTYANVEENEVNSAVYNAIKANLLTTGLMYRGV